MMVEGHGVVRMRELATVGSCPNSQGRALNQAADVKTKNEEYIVFVIRRSEHRR